MMMIVRSSGGRSSQETNAQGLKELEMSLVRFFTLADSDGAESYDCWRLLCYVVLISFECFVGCAFLSSHVFNFGIFGI